MAAEIATFLSHAVEHTHTIFLAESFHLFENTRFYVFYMEKNTSMWKYRIDFLARIVDDQSESEWTEIHGGYVEQKQNRNYTLFIFLFSFIVICTQVFFFAPPSKTKTKKNTFDCDQ